jgi:N-acetylneuraminic acid mutarotase
MSWTPVGNLNIPRFGHTATLLPGGKVLIYGGGGSLTAAPELYDPRSRSFDLTTSAHLSRNFSSASLLANGKVFVAGGSGGANFADLTSTELYDPVTAEWQRTGSMGFSRQLFASVVLSDGRVMLIGGDALDQFNKIAAATCEIYDPAQQIWTRTGDLNIPRFHHTATLLADGRVLVMGGDRLSEGIPGPLLNTPEVYDPVSGTWSFTTDPFFPRNGQTATRLNDVNGKVLVAGGATGGTQNTFPAGRSVELYDPKSGTWSSTGILETARTGHVATILHDGRVLVQGGQDLATAEIYNPTTFGWTSAGSIPSLQAGSSLTLLAAGRVLPGQTITSEVLLAGGAFARIPVGSCYLYDSGTRSVASPETTSSKA